MPLTDFLADLAAFSGPVPWTGWLPLLVEAQSPQAWERAWAALDSDSQEDVINRLYKDHSVYADVLRQLAVAGSEGLPAYDTVREALLDDAANAAGRNAERLRDLRQRVADLGVILDTTQVDELELGAKVAELESKVAGFRADDVAGRYSTVLALREEANRLQHQADAVRGVDLSAEQARLDQLQDDIAAAEAEKERLRVSVRSQKEALVQTEQETSRLRTELTHLDKQVSRAATERDRVQDDIDRLTEQASQREQETQVLAERQEQVRRRLRKAQTLFDELSRVGSASTPDDTRRLLEEVRALVRDLPASTTGLATS